MHHNPRGIRFRTVIVKIVASALTIGSGGSGGREGPTGQISAGFASLLARELDLSPADARTAVSAGIGSGIGAIFGAPLGGAVLASEILYRDDFDGTALLPSFIASIALAHVLLRRAGLPGGVIVTSIERGGDLIVPVGDTVLEEGDRLVVIGGPEGIEALRAIASG